MGDNNEMDLQEIGWDGADSIHLAHESDQWRVLVNNGTGHSGSIKGRNFTIS
jgi:hypothetical protein